MNKDCEILNELEEEIGERLQQLDPDQIDYDYTSESSYAVDESGYMVGVNLSNIKNLKRIPETFLKCKHLEKLFFYRVSISDYSMLEKLPHLVSLTICYSSIDDIPFLQGLSHLTTLNLSYNRLTDINGLLKLSNLTTLNLRDNQIIDISALQKLSNLTILNLSYNQITDISALQKLSNLTILDLSYNRLIDISALQKLSNLTILNLSYNRLTDIFDLQWLKHLTLLDLRDNIIKKLPEAIVDMEMEIDVDNQSGGETGIYLKGNPLDTLPPEIIRKGKDAIKAYSKSLIKAGKRPLNEVKVLLVGDGGAGKTSLVKRIMEEGFDFKEGQTKGIRIAPWKVMKGKNEIKAHLWDFGGQEIMHASHQFFLSKRSLYILVLDGRKDEKTEYWLKHICSFGGDSPVLVVLNKIDQNPGFELNRRFLQDKYKNIKGFFRLSCADKTGIDEFKEALEKTLCNVEIIRTIWAENWFNVKQYLEKMTAPFISLEEYNQVCLGEKIEEQSGRDTLVQFLHDLGVILHFDDLGLGDVHVLDPRWVTEAVYKIINAPITAEKKGILKLEFLADILEQKRKDDYCYPPDKHHYIVELMKKFEICYQLNKGEMLIPDLLAVEESEFKFGYAGSLRFIFAYDFLPPSVMPRFIVRMHNDIKKNCRWRTGVLLENIAFNAVAVVKADYEEKKIFIYVSGQQKRDYFSVIRHTIRDINAGFEKINAVEQVPLPGSDTVAVKYDELTGLKRMKKSEICIGELGREISIDLLLEGIESKEERKVRDVNAFGDISAAGDVTIINMKGNGSTFTVNITEMNQKLELIIRELEEHQVPGREELIRQLRDEEVKKDKKQLRGVLGKVLTRAVEVGSIVSTIASLLA
ncbi:MAG TPA: COR domain-containing protein [Candidatus Deferrimicrobium sp.]|nr:COR domain-containing protein [Candidatus Deferrimicrobium sp.]